MTRNDVNRSVFSTLDAGKLLPGCSVPIAVSRVNERDHESGGNESDDNGSLHAFREFEPLPIDGLSKSAARALTDSMVDVGRSLQMMHDSNVCYGRITSTSFHNRGTAAEPAATLWIDPSKAVEPDAVHSGDPEAMYWTAARLQTGHRPTRADDWYALGIVLAEIALSSTSVHKIWELGQQNGRFVENLNQNLRKARADKRLKGMAIRLIQEGLAGNVSRETISKLTTRRGTPDRKLLFLSIATSIVLLLLMMRNMQRTNQKIARFQSEFKSEAEFRLAQFDQLKMQVGEAVAKVDGMQAARERSASDQAAVSKQTPPVGLASDREHWREAFAGRSLEQVIESSSDFRPADWREALRELQSIPGQKQWRAQDQGLRRMVQRAVDTPWDAAAIRQSVDRLMGLNDAQSRWSDWARSRRSVEEIKTQHQLMPSGSAKEFLGQWLGEALEIYSFDLRVKMIQAGEGNKYLAHVIGVQTPMGTESLDWAWESTGGSGESIEFEVGDYRAGQVVSFWLQQDSAIPYWNRTVIEHTFDSPLLVWQLAQGVKLSNAESGYSLLLTTNKRFGPPANLDQSTSRPGVIEDKKVVDPMDSLPL
jgi:hypothetical protein